jgi:DNA-binding MarR family transcriptional regulator
MTDLSAKALVSADLLSPEAEHGAAPLSTKEARTLVRDAAQTVYRESGYNLVVHPAHLLRRAHQRATLSFQQVMAGEALSPTQFAALAAILDVGEVSQNHLGRLTAMDPSTISLVIRKLLKEGLVDRTRSETDQRLTILRLTEKGTRYTLDRLDRSLQVGQRVLAPLNKAEQAMFLDLLGRIADGDAGASERSR